MPEHFKKYCESLTAEQAEELADWLDGDPDEAAWDTISLLEELQVAKGAKG